MGIPSNKKKLLIGFVLISAIFLFLRLKTLGHLLMWDEAWNILSLRAFLSNAKADPFYWGYFFHPPFYMTFARFFAPFQAGFDIRLESLSLVFSYATLLVTYLLSARIGGWKYAWMSGLLLSLMPASIGYDTWIKRDGLASVLCYLAILLLLKRKFFWCAIALSFALLSKESALFFIVAVVPILFLLKERITIKKITVMCATIFILTSWWYILFSSLTKTVFKIYFQATDYYTLWANSPIYYFKKLLPDLGAAMLLFFIIGAFYILYLIFHNKQFRWGIPLIIVAAVYIPSSFFITAKAPWLCLSARPALAMAAGAGMLLLIKMTKRSRLILAILILSFMYTLYTGLAFSYPQYHMETHPNGWPGADASKKLACYLNEHMKDDDRLMITEFAYWSMPVCAVFLYYWKGCPIEIIKGEQKAENVIKEIAMNKISWFVIADSPHPTLNFHPLVKDASNSVLGKPVPVGWSYVWNTKKLWSSDK
ncbi:MAG: hypothetical protein NTY76_04485 [Candidatus Omnitrophica bacterium]|nr:hypothetical protein [Candidatus Omnitrophota bacterium]